MIEILKELIYPVYKYFEIVFIKIKLILNNKTLKLKGNVFVIKTNFGRHVYIINSSISNSSINDFSYVASNTSIRNCSIGKFCCIGPNVQIGLAEHPAKNFVSIHPVFYSNTNRLGYLFEKKSYFQEYYNTEIGNDVWIGANVIIRGGVNIGDGAIIASGSIVTKDVEAFSIVGGIPAKLIKFRFSNDEILFLKKIKWWNNDFEYLKKNKMLFHDVKELMKYNSCF